MKKTIINNFVCNVLYTSKRLKKRVHRLAKQIAKDYKNKEEVTLLIVINGGMDFGLDLSRALEKIGFKHKRETITATRYTGDGKGTKKVEISHKPNLSLENKNVIVIEDLVDKGVTLHKLHLYLQKQKTKSLNYAVLGTKEGHTFAGKIKYKVIEKSFPDLWLFGYGMDWEGEYRSIKCIMYNTQKKFINKKD